MRCFRDIVGTPRHLRPIAWAFLDASAVVTWSRPTENTDGSPLTNLAGYVLYYGTGFPVPFSAIYIEPNATALEIQNLAPGNWYFQIESVNTEGMPSELSPTVFKTIQ